MAVRLVKPEADAEIRGRRPHVGGNPGAPAHAERGDLCTARPGTFAERLGQRSLSGVHPVIAAAIVALVGYVLLAAAAVGFGFLLTDVLLPGTLQRWDDDVVRTLAEGRPTFDTASLIGSYLAEFATVLVVGGITIAICLWRHWYRLASLFTIAICMEGAVYAAATYFVTRDRPNVPRLEDLIVADSYPSGHVAASVVLWGVIALIVWNATRDRRLRALAVFMAVVAPVIVALSRMYRGMHHPTDAIVGYLIGWGCILIALLAVRTASAAFERRRHPTDEPSRVGAR